MCKRRSLFLALFMATLCNRAGHYIFALWFLLSFYLVFFPRLMSGIADWMSTILYIWCGPSANLECRSEMYCTRLAGNAGPQNSKNSPSGHHRTNLSGYVFATKEKKLLNSNVSPTCPHNMANFGPLAAEICWRVWGTPPHFSGFRVLAALLHGTLVVGVSQTLRR